MKKSLDKNDAISFLVIVMTELLTFKPTIKAFRRSKQVLFSPASAARNSTLATVIFGGEAKNRKPVFPWCKPRVRKEGVCGLDARRSLFQ